MFQRHSVSGVATTPPNSLALTHTIAPPATEVSDTVFSKVNRTYGWCVAWPLAAGTVAPAFGQTVGSIEGTVADGQGLRRHATLPQSWIQRENWEFETHRRAEMARERKRQNRVVGTLTGQSSV